MKNPATSAKKLSPKTIVTGLLGLLGTALGIVALSKDNSLFPGTSMTFEDRFNEQDLKIEELEMKVGGNIKNLERGIEENKKKVTETRQAVTHDAFYTTKKLEDLEGKVDKNWRSVIKDGEKLISIERDLSILKGEIKKLSTSLINDRGEISISEETKVSLGLQGIYDRLSDLEKKLSEFPPYSNIKQTSDENERVVKFRLDTLTREIKECNELFEGLQDVFATINENINREKGRITFWANKGKSTHHSHDVSISKLQEQLHQLVEKLKEKKLVEGIQIL